MKIPKQHIEQNDKEAKNSHPTISPITNLRTEATTQRKLHDIANNNPKQEKIAQLQAISQKQENNTGLPDNLKSGIENLSGIDMNDVKVHYNSSKPAQLNALAYAQGTNIHIGSGQEKHLPHEAWHVVQQKQGRVKPTLQMQGTAINDDIGLEKEADTMGRKALLSSTHNKITELESKNPNTVQKNSTSTFESSTAQQEVKTTDKINLSASSNQAVVQTVPWGLVAGVGAGLGLAYAAAKWWKGNSKKNNDAFRPLVMTGDIQQIKENVDTAMLNIKEKLLAGGAQELNTRGRDMVIYAPLGWLLRKNSAQLLASWSPSWSITETAGLLLDIGSAVKGVKELSEMRPREDMYDGELDKPLRHGTLTREHRTVRDNDNVPGPEWGLEEMNWDFQAGPSATTANLLKLLRTLGFITHIEIESIMEAVVMYWEGNIKRTKGDYHTAAEVWMAYQQHLEIARPDWEIPDDLDNATLLTLEQQLNIQEQQGADE